MELKKGRNANWIKTGGAEMLQLVNQHVRSEPILTVSGFHRDMTMQMEKENRLKSFDVER